jgi:hypothetical protein
MLMSVWKNRPDGRTVRRNKIATQFAWQSIEMLESPAHRVLSLSARRVIDRIHIEHAHHGGQDNGKLPVTHRDFHEYGIHWDAIAPAIREAAALGFIRITQVGRAGNGEFRIPNQFALTHLPTERGQAPATEDWRRIKDVEEATMMANAARKASARFGKLIRKSRAKKQNATPGNRISTVPGNRRRNIESPSLKTGALPNSETGALSISWVETARSADIDSALLVWTTPMLDELPWDIRWQRIYRDVIAEPPDFMKLTN